MAFDISTDSQYIGRFTAADADYPRGSSKNETSPSAGDGSPYLKIRADDLMGFQQGLLRSAGIVPSGDADTALVSEYLQALVEIASGRAYTYDDVGSANVYTLAAKPNQQTIRSYSPNIRMEFVAANTNTGPSTVQAPGLSTIDIEVDGNPLTGGEIVAGDLIDVTLDATGTIAELDPGESVLSGSIGISEINTNELGPVVQVVEDSTAVSSALSPIIPLDDTPVQNTEGTQILTVAITPKRASNILIIDASGYFGSAANSIIGYTMALFQDSIVDAIESMPNTVHNLTQMEMSAIRSRLATGATSPVTINLRVGPGGANDVVVNGNDSGRQYGGTGHARLTVTEYLKP